MWGCKKASEQLPLIIVAISRNTFDPEVNDGLENSSILCRLDAALDFTEMWTPSVDYFFLLPSSNEDINLFTTVRIKKSSLVLKSVHVDFLC